MSKLKSHRRGVQAKGDIGETRIPGFSPPDRLSIADLTIDHALQMRETLNDGVIDDYAAALGRGDPFPPIVVFQEGDTYRVADGFHRVNAHKRAQLTHINAEIHVGGFPSALRYALTANAKHGLLRSEGDLRRAYRAAVGAGLVDATDTTGVQDLLRCTERHARRLTHDAREAAKAERAAEIQRLAEEGRTQREIAEELGIPKSTVDRLAPKRTLSEMGQGEAVAITTEETAQQVEIDEATGDVKAISGPRPRRVIIICRHGRSVRQ
ncbi:MAG: helix-turn-helix domain-containing protein [Chromatiales bacterium]|nr:helix-turn-helix domain-containing protein [Chromatiales bacterium]